MSQPHPNLSSSSAKSADRSFDLLCCGLIVLVTLCMCLPGISQGGLGWSDAPNHAFDGIFVYEFLRDWPIDHARTWAEEFYLRYPAIGIIVYYPPGFAVVEAGMFALMGVNILACRMTVLLFAVGAGLLMYCLGRRWFDRPTGLFAALLLATCPHGLLWMNDVMLEWPATFWILAAVYAYDRDRETLRARWAVAFAFAVVMAFMTKQTAGFILPVLLFHALIARRHAAAGARNDRGAWIGEVKRYFLRPALLLSLIAACLIIGGYIIATRKYTALPAQLLRPSMDVSGLAHWPVEILGWPLLPIAALGLGTLILMPDRGPRGLLLLWFAAWTGFSLSIAAKEPRYLFFSLPPLMFAAVRFCIRGSFIATGDNAGQSAANGPSGIHRTLSWNHDKPRILLLSTLVIVQVVLSRWHWTGHLPSYAGSVAAVVARPDADLVLVDAVRDGQFIFDMYQNDDARRRIIPLRASKLLYARAAREKYDYQQFVESPADIVAMLDRYGIRYIVIESGYPATPYADADPPPRKMLRELLSDDTRFALVEAWPLDCGDPIWDGIELRLYEYKACPPRTDKRIRLSIPAMGREVEFELPSSADRH